MDLDPDKVTNNMDEAALQAELMKQFQGPPTNQQKPPAGANPMDPTGAGGGTTRPQPDSIHELLL